MSGTKRKGIRVFVAVEMIFIFATQGIFLLVISSPSKVYQWPTSAEVDRIRSAYASEASELTIRCRRNLRIRIEYANYVRLTANIVYGERYQNVNCSSNNSLSIVQRRCDHHRSCNIEAYNDVFKGPCTEPPVYLHVDYSCRPGGSPDRIESAELISTSRTIAPEDRGEVGVGGGNGGVTGKSGIGFGIGLIAGIVLSSTVFAILIRLRFLEFHPRPANKPLDGVVQNKEQEINPTYHQLSVMHSSISGTAAPLTGEDKSAYTNLGEDGEANEYEAIK